jgi:hypothetical protein
MVSKRDLWRIGRSACSSCAKFGCATTRLSSPPPAVAAVVAKSDAPFPQRGIEKKRAPTVFWRRIPCPDTLSVSSQTLMLSASLPQSSHF